MKITTLHTGLIQTNTYLFETKNALAVVDPGDDADKILKKALELGKPVKFILLTHAHYDHVGAVAELQKLGAIVHMHSLEEELTKCIYGIFKPVKPDVLVCSAVPLYLDGVRVDVLHTPGHSAGSVCYLVGENLFSGDTLFLEEIGRCDLPSGDFTVMKKSLKKILALPKNYRILPGHGDETTLEHERKHNRYVNA